MFSGYADGSSGIDEAGAQNIKTRAAELVDVKVTEDAERAQQELEEQARLRAEAEALAAENRAASEALAAQEQAGETASEEPGAEPENEQPD